MENDTTASREKDPIPRVEPFTLYPAERPRNIKMQKFEPFHRAINH